MTKYLIEFDEVANLSIEQFKNLINNTEGIKLSELKVKDLTYCNEQIINPGHGIYIFKADKEILLVGKARTTSFTERIPKHFDIRTNAWFNRLLYVICKRKNKWDKNEENYLKSSKFAFESASLILVNMKNPQQIDQFEKILRGTIKPLNEYKNLKYDMNIVLSQI